MNKELLKTQSGQSIDGPIVIKTNIFDDQRGFFYESWNSKIFNELVLDKVKFVQDNISFSKKGVLRGLHYQVNPFIQGKLVRCIKGKIFDVIVDLRTSSSTFLGWSSILLSDKNCKQLWVPGGFAHGFLTISTEAIVKYKVNNYWEKDSERTLKWNDSDVNIRWPIKEFDIKKPFLSEKDASARTFIQLKENNDLL